MIPLFFVSVAMAGPDGGTVEFHLAQARQFVKNHWMDDAAAEIEAALEAPGGRDDFDVNWLGAQVYYELVDIDRALPLARHAAEVAPGPEKREAAANFADFLAQTFGWVRVVAPHEGLISRLQVECTSLVLDPDLKRLINKVSLDVRDRTPLPTRFALPAGDYLVNGATVTVNAGETSALSLGMNQIGARGLEALQVTRFEVSSGMSVVFGDRVDNQHPAAIAEISLTKPIGPVLLGLVGDYDFRTYSIGNGHDSADPHSFSGGVRAGYEIALGGPLGFRPSAGVRYGMVPGIPFSCHDATDGLSCAPPDGSDEDAEVYAVGTAWTPYAEISVEYREAGRTTAWGAGVKAVLEHSFGTVASREVNVGDTATAFTADPATFESTGLRLLANVSFAF